MTNTWSCPQFGQKRDLKDDCSGYLPPGIITNYSVTQCHKKKSNYFIISHNFTSQELRQAHLTMSPAPYGINWNHSVEFIWWRAGLEDQKPSLPCLAPGGDGWQAGHSWTEESWCSSPTRWSLSSQTSYMGTQSSQRVQRAGKYKLAIF